MKKINSKGYKISTVDKKALDHYLNVEPGVWAHNALRGMVNKAVKSIMREWFEKYKAIQDGDVSADLSAIIPGIIAMEDFKPFNVQAPEAVTIDKKEASETEIWEGGFDVEDYELDALNAYYEDPEAMMEWFMTNKIDRRRKAFVKEKEVEMINDPGTTIIPKHHDDFINLVCSKPGYKNRKQKEAEEEIS